MKIENAKLSFPVLKRILGCKSITKIRNKIVSGIIVRRNNFQFSIFHFQLKKIKVVIAQGFHLFPFRTEKLSLVTPMVLRKWESR